MKSHLAGASFWACSWPTDFQFALQSMQIDTCVPCLCVWGLVKIGTLRKGVCLALNRPVGGVSLRCPWVIPHNVSLGMLVDPGVFSTGGHRAAVTDALGFG